MPTLTSPDLVVRSALLAALRGHAPLMVLVNRVEDGTPGQAAAPYVVLGESLGSDWGSKTAEGRELLLGLSFYVRSGDSIRVAAALRAAELALASLPRDVDGWQIASARIVRTRIAGSAALMKPPGWAALMDVRVRVMALGEAG